MRTIDDLGDAARQARPRPRDLNVPLDGTTRSPTTAAIRASRADDPRACVDAGARVVVVRPPRPARRARPRTEVLARARSPPGSASCSARRWRFATDTVGRVGARTPSPASATATSRCWRTSASTRARPARTTPSAAPSPTSSPRSATPSSATASASCTASRPASTTSPQRLPHAAGRPGARRGRRARAAHRGPGAARTPSCSAARRSRDKLGVIDNLLPQRRPAARRRRHGVHLPRRPGPRGRHEPARGGPARHGARLPRRRPQERGVEIVLPIDVVVADAVRGRRRARRRRRPTRSRPTGWAWTSARESARAVRRARSPTPGRCSGTARWACSSCAPFAAGTRAVAQALTEVDGPHRRRRRRLRRRRPPRSASTTTVRPHLDRRRRAAWSSSRARRCPASRSWRTEHRWRDARPHPAHGGQLEDEPRPPPGHRTSCRSSPGPSRTPSTTSTRSRSRCCRRSPTCARADPGRRRQAAARATAPRTSPRTTPAPTPARSPARSSPSSAARYVVVGHTERREYHGETDDVVNAKVKAAFRHGLDADPLRRRGPGGPPGRRATCAHTLAQLDGGLDGRHRRAGRRPRRRLRAGLGDRHRRGRPPPRTPRRSARAIRAPARRAVLGGDVGRRGPRPLRRLGQGRATSRRSWREPDVDGALVGGASLDADEFASIVPLPRQHVGA